MLTIITIGKFDSWTNSKVRTQSQLSAKLFKIEIRAVPFALWECNSYCWLSSALLFVLLVASSQSILGRSFTGLASRQSPSSTTALPSLPIPSLITVREFVVVFECNLISAADLTKTSLSLGYRIFPILQTQTRLRLRAPFSKCSTLPAALQGAPRQRKRSPLIIAQLFCTNDTSPQKSAKMESTLGLLFQ